jgi:LuxR family maltose regulon positive regulatory protein
MVIENLILQALAIHSKGQSANALNTLQAALSMAKTEGFIRVFVDEGLPMEELLKTAAAHGIAPEYVHQLLISFGKVNTIKPPKVAAGTLVEPLSKRELEVLALIEQGLSNDEIARSLFISLSTVKGHLANIYGKLDARNRTQAVSRARSLGLLPSE